MKASIAISTGLHILVFGFGLIPFSSPSSTVPFNIRQKEPLPVSLVLLADEISIRGSDLAPAKIETSQEKKNVENIDGNKADLTRLKQETQELKEAEISFSDVPNIDSSFAPQAPNRTESSIGEKQETETHQLEYEQAPIKQLKKSGGNPTEMTLLQKKPDPILTLPETVPLPNKKPKHIKKTATSPLKELIKQPFSLDDNDVGAKNDQESTAFGDRQNIDDSSFQQTLNNIIGNCIQQNWNLAAINGSTAYDLRVIVHFGLNQDGTFDGEANLMPDGGDTAQREIIAIQAREALKKCAPFVLPIEKYSQWREVIVNMKAFPD